MVRVGIIGASGFTGAELLRLAAQHPEFEVVLRDRRLAGRRRRGRRCTRASPRPTRTWCSSRSISTVSRGLDLVFLGLPHEASMALAPELVGRVGCVVDLSAAYRLKDAAPVPDVLRVRARPAGAARRRRVRAARAAPRRAQGRRADRHARLLRHGGDARPAAARRGGPDRDHGRDRRRRVRRHRRRPQGRLRLQLHDRSTRTSPPTGCSTTATRRRWSRRSAPSCCSRRIWRR